MRGESERIDELYRRHVPAALGLAKVLLRDEELARDLVHDAFVRVAARLRHIGEPDAFSAYLRRAVINAIASDGRRRSAERRALARQVPPLDTADDAAALLSDRDKLARALSQLPSRQRMALVCRFYLDWSEERTAEAMGCATGTVKSLTSRGLAALRGQRDDWLEDAR